MPVEQLVDMEDLRITPKDLPIRTEVLKEGQTFFISLVNGSVPVGNLGGLGLYYRDTRYLSSFEFYIERTKPVLLSSSTRESHFVQEEFTNEEMVLESGESLPIQSLHVRLLRVLKRDLLQRCRLINFNPYPVTAIFRMVMGADYRDIFEIRGTQRKRRGEYLPPQLSPSAITFGYRGLDGVERRTQIEFDPAPQSLRIEEGLGVAEYRIFLPPQKKIYLNLRVSPFYGREYEQARSRTNLDVAFSEAALAQARSYRAWRRSCTSISCDHEIFNRMFDQNITDLYSLRAEYDGLGSIVEAGVPWFAAPFGRDAMITSWETLMVNPDLARQSLRFLAQFQGQRDDPLREEKPGKILHELRFGEMAACGEVLGTPYYGSADSTLWFIIVLGETYRWTRDLELVRELEGPLHKALAWCRYYGDLDGDGYVEYKREGPVGLDNQGWKDSWDAVVTPEGYLPSPPIALVEVQAYLYLAMQRASELLGALGRFEEAERWWQDSQKLKQQFLRDFWLDNLGYMAFALDGNKRQISTTVSNPGHCLFTGVLPDYHAERVARRLFEPDMYSGWGIRTMSKREKAYNPMSYHNGSVWPHDNAIIARGLRRYGHLELMEKLANGLWEAAFSFAYFRLPELFCGFTRRFLGGPVHYPTACDPQAWAVGSNILLLQSMLGLEVNGEGIHIQTPLLPRGVNELHLRDLQVGKAKVDLEFGQSRGKIYCNVLRREGPVRVTIEA